MNLTKIKQAIRKTKAKMGKLPATTENKLNALLLLRELCVKQSKDERGQNGTNEIKC